MSRPSRGVTLIELIIGIAVLLTALLGLLGVFLGIRSLNESAHSQTIATHHADRIMEEIRNDEFATIQANAQAADDTDWVSWAADRDLDLTEDGLNSVTVDFDPPFEGGEAETWDDDEDPLRVQVLVNWNERGRDRTTYLESLITDRTP